MRNLSSRFCHSNTMLKAQRKDRWGSCSSGWALQGRRNILFWGYCHRTVRRSRKRNRCTRVMSKGKAASAGASVPRPGPHLSQKLPSIMSYWPTSTYPHPSLPCDHRNIGSQCSEVFLYLSSHLFEPFFSSFLKSNCHVHLEENGTKFLQSGWLCFPHHSSPSQPLPSWHLSSHYLPLLSTQGLWYCCSGAPRCGHGVFLGLPCCMVLPTSLIPASPGAISSVIPMRSTLQNKFSSWIQRPHRR